MSGVLRLVRKALTASPGEWRWRCRQARFTTRNALAGLLGTAALPPDGHIRSLGIDRSALFDWWASRERPWFLDPPRQKALAIAFCSGSLAEAIKRADVVCEGRMPLFSFPPISFSDENRWRRDPISGQLAPQRVYARVPYLEPETVGDNKLVWEPNRWAWSLSLGLAHAVTREIRYREAFVDLAVDWFDQNPYPIGINYCSALEVGLRAYAWIWSLAFFGPSLQENDTLLDHLVGGIWTSCRHVEENLSYYFSPNTHLTGEAFCLYACGAAFPEFQEAPRWRALGQEILGAEAKRQFFSDGTHRELSSGYQLYSTEFFLQACLIGCETGFPPTREVWSAARLFCDRLAELVPVDLVLPQFNDCDGGRLLHLGEQQLDAAPALSAAASLWSDFVHPFARRDRSGYALLMAPRKRSRAHRGGAGAKESGELSDSTRDSGIKVYRNKHNDFLVFRANSFGDTDCPHSHDAALSFILYLDGRPVVIDSGVGAYTRDLPTRNQFRCANGKNVLLFEERGPSEPGSWFSWKRTTTVSRTSGEALEDTFRCRASHEGFSAVFGFSVWVEREIEARESGQVTIVDRWNAEAPISPSLPLTLSQSLEIDLENKVLRFPDDTVIRFRHDADTGTPTIVTGRVPFSPDYGCIKETSSLIARVPPSKRGSLTTSLSRCDSFSRSGRT